MSDAREMLASAKPEPYILAQHEETLGRPNNSITKRAIAHFNTVLSQHSLNLYPRN